jgi:LAO/AO transport system kinase
MKKENKSALHVNKGVEQPPNTNPQAKNNLFSKKKEELSANEYVKGILAGDRVILSKSITLIESNLEKHKKLAQEIIEKCLPHSGKSMRIGITGVPGVGKSTFIEALGLELVNQGYRLAVLAIDPSSGKSGGSILGDKTRMNLLSTAENAFIRPSPSSGSLGGVANKTREIMLLCEAAGYNVIFIETVGVGQSEVAVHSMVDFFLLLMLAGAGDELQGMKRGIMEMADALVINKADGDNIGKAKLAAAEYKSALHLFPAPESQWPVNTMLCSATEKTGIDYIWQNILNYFELTSKNGFLAKKRQHQAVNWLHQQIKSGLIDHFYQNEAIKIQLKNMEDKVEAMQVNAHFAATELLKKYFNKDF